MILSSLFPAFLVVSGPAGEDFIPDDKLASAPGMLYFPGNRSPVFAFLVMLSSFFPAFLIVPGPAREDFIPDDKMASAPGMLHFPGNRRLTVRCPVQPAPSSSVVSGPLQSIASPSDQVTSSLFQCIAMSVQARYSYRTAVAPAALLTCGPGWDVTLLARSRRSSANAATDSPELRTLASG